MLYIYDLSRNFLKIATKENLQTKQRKSKYGTKLVLIKFLTLFNYWSNQMERLTAAVKIFLLT